MLIDNGSLMEDDDDDDDDATVAAGVDDAASLRATSCKYNTQSHISQ